MNELKVLLEEYKDLSLEILNESEINNINELLEKRQEKIDKINNLNYTKTEFTEIVKSFELIEIEKKIERKIKKEKFEAKSQLDNLKKMREAGKSYTQKSGVAVYFNGEC